MGKEKSPTIRGGHWGGARPESYVRNRLLSAVAMYRGVLTSTSWTARRTLATRVTYHWYRTSLGAVSYNYGAFWAAAIPSGSSLRRVRWSWGFAGDTSSTSEISATTSNIQAAGLVTTIGNGTEVPPFALGGSGDVAPPTQRWIWWEQRQPVITAIDQASGVMSWRDSGPQETPDAKVSVLATGIPGGDTLNLWFTWQSYAGAWDATGSVFLWVATSVLYSTP